MFIDGKLPEGYVIICTHDDHSFLVRRLGLTVECPRCGHTRFSADLAADFHAERAGRPRHANASGGSMIVGGQTIAPHKP